MGEIFQNGKGTGYPESGTSHFPGGDQHAEDGERKL